MVVEEEDKLVAPQTPAKKSAFPFIKSFKGYRFSSLLKDILAGLIVAALTIPISMGYAQIAGLPPVYGLYGSIIPCLVYAFFASSPQMVFGVDAAAAAITGSIIAGAGVAACSGEALVMIPVLAFFTGVILIIFAVFRVGKLVSFISAPVMGGFISGVAVSIMVTQVPKIMGVHVESSEELLENLAAIAHAVPQTNWVAVLIGVVSFVVIMVSRKFLPKFPMPLVILIASAFICQQLELDKMGVLILGDVPSGLPPFSFPNLTFEKISTTLGYCLTIAIVITAESLLASNNFALKNHYRLDDNRELLAFGIANVCSSFVGAPPVSASVSRTAMSQSFGGKTQIVSLVAAGCIVGVLFLTPYLYYLPTPALAAIILSALTSVVEVQVAKRLLRCHLGEFFIFMAAGLGVLLVGILFGVVLGVFLSFLALLIRASDPPRGFLGTLPEHDGYFNMKRFPDAKPLPGVLIYRFSAGLSFANASVLSNEVEDAVLPETKVVIIDGSGIGAIDITAADRIEGLADALSKRGVAFYIAEMIPHMHTQFSKLGLNEFIEQGHIAKTIEDALILNDIDPYPGVSAEDFEKTVQLNEDGSYVRDADSVALGATEEPKE